MVVIEQNPEFKKAIDLMENTQRHLFVTGKAGTGKSTLLAYFCEVTKKKLVVLAPTGVAALNVKGRTIHSFFGFPLGITVSEIQSGGMSPSKDMQQLLTKIETIVIDEVSMLRADLLDCIDAYLRAHGPNKDLPFGGVQMVFMGDLYQLPPVVTSDEKKIFSEFYESPYFFSAKTCKSLSIEIVELEKIYRQKDPQFIELLNKIRNNSVEDSDIALLNNRFNQEPNDFDTDETSSQSSIHLTSTNKKADEINLAKLTALKGKAKVSHAQIDGDFQRDAYPTLPELQFKVESQIMMLNNDPMQRWVNGSIGKIKAIKKDKDGNEYLEVLIENQKKTVEVYQYVWEIFKYYLEGGQIATESIGSFMQYPFRLAWAVTIHKSQGKTFDKVVVDISNTFAPGQAYVALSRCTSFEGIVLKHLVKKGNIRTDFKIYKFLTGYQYQKAEQAQSLDDKVKLIEEAIKTKGKLKIVYLKANDTKSKREIIPISIGTEEFKGKEFLGVKGFCLSRHEERMFRVDRILEAAKS
jgi:ATP-dependent DNA helicase PIF1